MQNADLPLQTHHHTHALGLGAGAVLLGLALLLAGQRLFWLFVAALGFVLAEEAASVYLTHLDPAGALILGIIAGLAGALLAIFVQRLAVGLAGALAGAYYLRGLLAATALREPQVLWIAIIVGAVLGAVLFLALFKWALIFFSSVVGADLIAHTLRALDIGPGVRGAIFLALLVLGIFFQARGKRRVVEDTE